MGCVTVFGGTGFLGRRIVDALLARDVAVRVAARHPAHGGLATAGGRPAPVQADLRDPHSVLAALGDADAAVNAVSLYVEGGARPTRRSMSRAPAGWHGRQPTPG